MTHIGWITTWCWETVTGRRTAAAVFAAEAGAASTRPHTVPVVAHAAIHTRIGVTFIDLYCLLRVFLVLLVLRGHISYNL